MYLVPGVPETYCLMLTTSSKAIILFHSLIHLIGQWRNQSSSIMIRDCTVIGRENKSKPWWSYRSLMCNNTMSLFRSDLSAPLPIAFWRLPAILLLSIRGLIISLLEDHQLLTLLLECHRIFSPLSVAKPFPLVNQRAALRVVVGVILGFIMYGREPVIMMHLKSWGWWSLALGWSALFSFLPAMPFLGKRKPWS